MKFTEWLKERVNRNPQESSTSTACVAHVPIMTMTQACPQGAILNDDDEKKRKIKEAMPIPRRKWPK